MADINVTVNPAPSVSATVSAAPQVGVSIGEGIAKHAVTHAPGGSDSLEAYYATTGSLAYVSGLTTGIGETGYLTGYVSKTETGDFYPVSNPSGFITGVDLSNYVTGQVVRPSETGNFITNSETGVFYPTSNPSGFITGVDLSSYVTGDVVRPSETGDFITNSETGIFVTGDVVRPNETGDFVVNSQTGAFYPASNPSGFITGVDLSEYVTGSVVRPSETGSFITTSQTGEFYASSNPSGFITGVDLSNYVTGDVVRPSETGAFYPASNPSGFITGVDLSNYVTGDVVRPNETGDFITSNQTGEFYSTSNPSGYITGVDLSAYATESYVTGISGDLQNKIETTSGYAVTGYDDSITGISVAGGSTKTITLFQRDGTSLSAVFTDASGALLENVVYTTGDQDISGLKDFQTRLTVTDIPVLLSGEALLLTETGQFVTTGQTGQFVTGDVVRPSETGSFITTSDTGNFYPINNPSGFITGVDLSSYATTAYVTGVSGSLQTQITNLSNSTGSYVTGSVVRPSETGVFVTTGQTGQFVTGSVVRPSETGDFVTNSETGAFYPTSNPSGFITGVDLSSYATQSYVTGVSGHLQGQVNTLNSQTGNYVTGSVVRPSETGDFITSSETGVFVTGSVVRPSETGNFITTAQTGDFYPSSNPSGFITGVDLSAYVTGDVVRPSETGNFVTADQTGVFVTGDVVRPSETGDFVTTSQTGAFYPASNPSGFITGVDLSSYATTVYVTGVSGHLQNQINNLDNATGSYVTGDVVRPSETGDFVTTAQTGVFYPASNPSGYITGVDLSAYVTGDVVRPSETGAFLTTGAADSRYALQSETGSFITSSQTGAFYPASNPSGFITGVDLSAYVTGDVVRPSETGDFVTTSQTGVFVTGDVVRPSETGAFLTTGAADSRYALQSATGDFVTTAQTGAFYPNSNPSGFITGVDLSAYATTVYVTGVSGHLQDQITNLNNATGSYVTGDVVRPSETGNFITTSQTGQFVGDSETGAFLTTGAADARYVNLTGNQTVSGTKTFDSSVVLPSGAIVTGSGSISFDTSAAFTSAAAGEINWNSDEQTFNLGLNGDVTLQVGLEQLVKVKAGADIRNGMTVYAAGQVGASANIEVLPFIASADGPNEIYFLGIATQEILNGNEGFATTFGKVRNVDGAAYSAGGVRDDADGSWSVGNILYASPHISGTFTTGAPVSPEKTLEIAIVLAAPNESNLTLFVRAEHGYRLSTLHDVHIESVQNSDILKWNATSGRWENSNSINLSGISVSGNAVVTGAVVRPSETGNFITTSQTGQFVGDGETGAFLTTGAADARYALQSATGNFITTSQTGQFVGDSETGAFLTTGAADNRYALQSDTGNFITSSQTGAFAAAADTGAFLTTGAADVRYALQSATGDFVTTAQTGQFYPTSNPSGYITGVDLSAYVTGAVVRPSETGAFLTTGAADDRYALQSATGDFITTSQTGAFAAAANTGAFLTTGAADARYYGLADGQSISGYAITGYNDAVTGMTVTGDTTKTITLFQRDGGSITADFTDNGGAGATNVVYTTGDQIISGEKTFSGKLIARTGFFGLLNTYGNYSDQTIAGGRFNDVSGSYSTVGGGINGFAAGTAATVGGGQNAIASGNYSTVAGGYYNEALYSSFVGGGQSNKATGAWAAVLGGNNNAASANYSSVLGGNGADANIYGQIAHASSYFSNRGDAQYIHHVFYADSFNGQDIWLSPSNASSNTYATTIFSTNESAIVLATIQVIGFDNFGYFSQAVRKIVIRKLQVNSYHEEIVHIEALGTDTTNAGNIYFEININNYPYCFGIKGNSGGGSNTRWIAIIQGLRLSMPPPYP